MDIDEFKELFTEMERDGAESVPKNVPAYSRDVAAVVRMNINDKMFLLDMDIVGIHLDSHGDLILEIESY